jgi:hypothetical protein
MLQMVIFYVADVYVLCCRRYSLMLQWTNGAEVFPSDVRRWQRPVNNDRNIDMKA